MPLYTYTKRKKFNKVLVVKIFSIFLIGLGVLMMTWVLIPILSFNLIYGYKFGETVSPLPDPVPGINNTRPYSEILGLTRTDYTKASVWFPKQPSLPQKTIVTASYLLDIPKLKINDAVVKINSEDLSKSLVHFTGPQPGELGNIVIFGHSTIPWLYNTKDYKTIFTKLPDLTNGDDIYLKNDHISYRYKIIQMRIVSPDNLSVLDQDIDSSYVTLVTCVPPGTFFKRLIVKGRLISI